MKHKMMEAAALALALALAGCSSAPAAESVNSESAASETAKDGFENIKNALTNAGFSIENESAQSSQYSADALSEDGSVTVTVKRDASVEVARKNYKESLDNLQHDGYLQVNTYSGPDREMTVLLNDYNTVYGIVGVDDTSREVIVMQDILEANQNSSMDVMRTLGFTTTD